MPPRTIVIAGSGTRSQSFAIPAGLEVEVQSVFAEIGTPGTDEVRPTLTISDQSGEVIAAERQGEAIPAGDTGSATWALGLDRTVDQFPELVGCRIERSLVTNLPNNVAVNIDLDSVSFDTHGFYDAGPPGHILIPPGHGGEYLVVSRAGFAVNPGFDRNARLVDVRLNGSGGYHVAQPQNDSTQTLLSATNIISCVPGDTLHLNLKQQSGGALNATGPDSKLTIVKIAR